MEQSQLKSLVNCIPDLRKDLTAERVLSYQIQGPFLKLSYATELVTKEILEALFQFCEESRIHDWMHKMQAGEKVNYIEHFPSENRPALHTALRLKKGASFLSDTSREAAYMAWQQLDKLEDVLPSWDSFTDIVQVGIGGSSLGPEAVYEALKAYKIPGRRAHFVSNIDPDDVVRVLKTVPLARTLFVIVSKSGTTLETISNEAFIRTALQKAGIDPALHMIAVTGKGSPMDDSSLYRACFYIWDFVGGRYSVTSMVGAVMLSFTLGFDTFLQFLEGAYEMDQAALKTTFDENLPLMSALLSFWNTTYLKFKTVAVIPYSQALHRLPAHLQQLDMESNGKRINRQAKFIDYLTGPVLWGEPGTNGQHSFFQLLHQGTLVVPIEFIGFSNSQYGTDLLIEGSTSQEKLNGNLLAQVLALAYGQPSTNPNTDFPGNRPSRLLIGNRCDALTLGSLIAYYEHKVAFHGFLLNINSFDQEGVQLGKKLATEMIQGLAHQREGVHVQNNLKKSFFELFKNSKEG